LFLAIPLVIIITYRFARRRELSCPECKSSDYKFTGVKREIEVTKKALTRGPGGKYDYQYRCISCGNEYWSSIESIWDS